MDFRSGRVALIGKPNVGKSTLLNFIVGHKVSIVSNKPQTTRRSVLGIATTDTYQIAFVDTPGIHEPHNRLGRSMVEQARSALHDLDLVLYVVDGSKSPDDEDRHVAALVRSCGVPVVVCLNKMDKLRAEQVIRNVEAYCELVGVGEEDYMLTTATKGTNVQKLVDLLVSRLPQRAPLFPEDEFTDQSARFMAGEFVREKILERTREEVPHATGVVVESWQDEENIVRILASIIVDKSSQRAILLGRGGQFIKSIGTDSRKEIEEMLGKQIFLELHVRVEEGWRQNPRTLREMYD